jgi:hypothetical protein
MTAASAGIGAIASARTSGRRASMAARRSGGMPSATRAASPFQ